MPNRKKINLTFLKELISIMLVTKITKANNMENTANITNVLRTGTKESRINKLSLQQNNFQFVLKNIFHASVHFHTKSIFRVK